MSLNQPPKPTITREQFGYVAHCFSEWLRQKAAHEVRWKKALESPEARNIIAYIDPDFWHSALLFRMMVEGKDPLPEPPPLRHSYPDYDAVEGKTP